jgi:hypothetical protein
MAQHVYHDDGPLPESTQVGHETTDAEARPILNFLLFLTVFSVIVAVLMVVFYNYLERREAAEKTARYPMAAGRDRPLPPPPRLQNYPFDDIKDLRRSEERLLQRYQWVDQSSGVVRIPIDRAMDLVAERGLPHRTAKPGPEAPAPPANQPSTAAPDSGKGPAAKPAAPATPAPGGGH